MDIYAGNLPFSATEDDVSSLFADYGPVERVKLVTDRETGRPRGFGFVTLADPEKVEAAVAALDGCELDGRTLRVNASDPARKSGGGGGEGRRPPGGDRRGGDRRRSGGGGYGGGGGGGGGGYGGGGRRRDY